MKLLVLVSIITISSNVVLSQISGVFSLDKTGNENIVCDLYLYKEGVYEILLQEQETDDIISIVLFSYGDYKLKNNQIVLTDKYNGFKMLFEYQNNYVVAKETFLWLTSKKFIKSNFEIWDKPSFTKVKIKPLKQERLNFNQLYKTENILDFGEYCNEQGFSFNIQQNNKYKLEFKKIILSEGIWKRDKNELIVYDTTLKYTFCFLIDKKGLISRFLPGNDKGSLLNKK